MVVMMANMVNVNGGGTPSINWVNFGNANTPFLYNLNDGMYDLEITDSNDCISSLSIEITESPSPLTIHLESLSVSCFGASTGSAQVTANGGTPPYFINGVVDMLMQMGQIPSGIYSVEVTDSRGCSVIDSVVVEKMTK